MAKLNETYCIWSALTRGNCKCENHFAQSLVPLASCKQTKMKYMSKQNFLNDFRNHSHKTFDTEILSFLIRKKWPITQPGLRVTKQQ